MTKSSRRKIAAAMLPPKPPPPKLDVRPEQLPAGVASYHFLTDPEIKAAKEIAEYWTSHAEGVVWWVDPGVSAAERQEAVTTVIHEAALTEHQTRVMALLADGHSQRDVADTLGISRSSVRTHMIRGLAKVREVVGGRS